MAAPSLPPEGTPETSEPDTKASADAAPQILTLLGGDAGGPTCSDGSCSI